MTNREMAKLLYKYAVLLNSAAEQPQFSIYGKDVVVLTVGAAREMARDLDAAAEALVSPTEDANR